MVKNLLVQLSYKAQTSVFIYESIFFQVSQLVCWDRHQVISIPLNLNNEFVSLREHRLQVFFNFGLM